VSDTSADAASTHPVPRVVLVETSDALPGLLPFQAWDVLGTADEILARDPQRHPSQPHLYMAGLDLETIAPASLERHDLDLTRPGDPADRRIAKALLARAVERGRVVYLLGPDDTGLSPALAGMAPEHDAEIELVFLAQQPPGTEVLTLVQLMRRLRDPDHGCPWDLEQDHASLIGYLLEEAYELVEAIEHGEDADLQEELGDVLLQVVFHAQVASDRGSFGIDDVARGIAEKLIRRHPHVFADGDASTPEEVQANWDELKADEKGRGSPFEGIPTALPGLLLLETLQRRAAKLGLDEPSAASAGQRLARVLERLDPGADADTREDAVGEALGLLVAAARALGVEPEAAARRAGRRFRERAEAALALARERGLDPSDLDEDRWAQLLQEVRPGGPSAPTE
jgi:XTP/dITP diphosphohydrolase